MALIIITGFLKIGIISGYLDLPARRILYPNFHKQQQAPRNLDNLGNGILKSSPCGTDNANITKLLSPPPLRGSVYPFSKAVVIYK